MNSEDLHHAYADFAAAAKCGCTYACTHSSWQLSVVRMVKRK